MRNRYGYPYTTIVMEMVHNHGVDVNGKMCKDSQYLKTSMYSWFMAKLKTLCGFPKDAITDIGSILIN